MSQRPDERAEADGAAAPPPEPRGTAERAAERAPAPSGGPSVEALLERHLAALRAYVQPRMGRLLRARETSVDLVQSVCRDVLLERERFEYRGEASFRRWLEGRALHKIVDRGRFWRRGKRDPGREAPPSPSRSGSRSGGAGSPDAATILTPSRCAAAREDVAALERALARLSPEHREVIVLARVAGLPHAAVAERLGKSEGAVRKALARALARLATLMDAERGA